MFFVPKTHFKTPSLVWKYQIFSETLYNNFD